MNELIAINYATEEPTVLARDLHEKLNIESNFTTWFKRMCEYGFEEGKDFFPKLEESRGGRPAIDYAVGIDMAKQICMIQRSPEGKLCRQYFIDLEKAWNTPEQIFARALKMADRTIENLKSKNNMLAADNNRMKPKEIFADAVASSNSTILIGDLAKILNQNGIVTGQKRLFEWMRNNGYLVKRSGADYNMPTQKAIALGVLEIKESVTYNPDGSVRINRTPKVTGKGQQYFINKLLVRD